LEGVGEEIGVRGGKLSHLFFVNNRACFVFSHPDVDKDQLVACRAWRTIVPRPIDRALDLNHFTRCV
jgi:hypothetical protein